VPVFCKYDVAVVGVEGVLGWGEGGVFELVGAPQRGLGGVWVEDLGIELAGCAYATAEEQNDVSVGQAVIVDL